MMPNRPQTSKLPTRAQAYVLCQTQGKEIALHHLRSQLSAAGKSGIPAMSDLSMLCRTILEIEKMAPEELEQKASAFQPPTIYRIPPSPTEAQIRADRKRQAQEWLDDEAGKEDDADLAEDEDIE